MRENRYEDIRRDVVNRTGNEERKKTEMPVQAQRNDNQNSEQPLRKDQEGTYEEYNSWS